MKALKTTLSFILSLIIAASVIAVPASAAEVKTKEKSMLPFTSINLTFDKAEEDEYTCTVKNNDKDYVKVDANNEGTWYWLSVKSLKPTTANKKPEISVYKKENGSKTLYKKFRITVTAFKTVKFANVRFNKNTTKVVTLINPYLKDYTFKYSKKIAKINPAYFQSGKRVNYEVKGLKNGSTTVKVYLGKTGQKIGSFKITVGDFKAGIKKSGKNITLKYNKHINTLYLDGGSINLGTLIKNFHSGATYTIKAKNSKLVATKTAAKEELTPKAVNIYTKKTGKTTLTVYEKRAKAKTKKKIGTINLTVKKATDADVCESNMEYDNDGIFYELFIYPGDSINLKSMVVGRYINLGITESHFKSSEYTFTVTSDNSDIISVDKNGVCTCKGIGSNYVRYNVKFADGSKISGGGSFSICEEDEL